MAYLIIALMLLLLCVSTPKVEAAANLTSSSTNQTVKVLIEKAIISLTSGDGRSALSNLTLADRLLGGSIYSGIPQVTR